jgi:hypothetical protein
MFLLLAIRLPQRTGTPGIKQARRGNGAGDRVDQPRRDRESWRQTAHPESDMSPRITVRKSAVAALSPTDG